MAYGILKVDTITFTDAGVDKSVTISGLVQNPTFSGNITVTGTVSGNTIQGQTVSGATITGGAAAFTTVTGGVATITSGVFALGSASNPSISFTGDANTGLYSPGADQVAISTGGSGRLFVDASGNVGVGGAASPWSYTALSVGFGGSAVSSDAVDKVQLGANFYRGSGADRFAGTGFATLYQQNAGAHVWFRSSASGTAGNAMTLNESMRITSAGLVGVGTSSPGTRLHVVNDIEVARFSATSASTVYATWQYGTSTSVGYVGNGGLLSAGSASDFVVRSDAALAFATGGSAERLRIDSSGRVGVGTTSPGATLDVNGNIRISSAVGLEIASSSNSTITYKSGGSSTAYYTYLDASRNYIWQDNATERMRIDSSGRVGIGTSSPIGRLHSVAATTSAALTLSTPDTGVARLVHLFGGQNYSYGVIGVTAGTGVSNGDAFSLGSSSNPTGSFSPTLTWTTSAGQNLPGNVGIGTTSPGSALEVVGAPPEIRIRSTTASDGFIRFTNTSGSMSVGMSGAAQNIFLLSDRTNGHAAYQYVGGASGAHIWLTANTERARIDSSGRLGIGIASPANKLDIACSQGDGIRIIESTSGNNARLLLTQESAGVTYNATYSAGSNAHIWQVANTERARIDSSGRLLVGTSSARSTFFGASYTSALQVETASVNNPNGLSIGVNTNDDNPANLYLFKTRGTSVGSNTAVQNGDVLGNISFIGANGTDLSNTAAWIRCIVDGVPFSSGDTTDLPGALVFSTTADGASSPTERMRISQAGLVDIGNQGTAPTGIALTVRSSSDNDNVGSLRVGNINTAAAATVAAFVTATNSTAASNVLIRFGIDNFNTGSGQINANGSGSVAFGTFSDSRLKENVKDLPSQWNNIKGLRPVEFDYIESEGGGHQIGFIAQNVQQIYPDVVGDRGDGMLTLSGMSKQDSRLIKALQEAMERIETLEQRLNDAGIN